MHISRQRPSTSACPPCLSRSAKWLCALWRKIHKLVSRRFKTSPPLLKKPATPTPPSSPAPTPHNFFQQPTLRPNQHISLPILSLASLSETHTIPPTHNLLTLTCASPRNMSDNN